MKKITIEIAKEYISNKATEIPLPYWFNFDSAIQYDHITDELAEKMQEFVSGYPYFKQNNDGICIDDEDGGTFSESSIDLICDVLIANFLPDLIASYQHITENSGYYAIRDWFITAVVEGAGSTQCDEIVCCDLSCEVLKSYPCNDDSILEELDILLKNKYLTQKDWNWLELVASNSHELKIENRLVKIVKKFGK